MDSKALLWQQTRVNLAARHLGSDVLHCSDDFFAEKDNLLLANDPVFIPEKYTAYGKWMDGWESRRRRSGDRDWVIVRLAAKGVPEAVEVDTRHFKGNAPAEVLLQYLNSDTDPDEHSHWLPLTDRLSIKPDFRNLIDLPQAVTATHIRLNIFPDGGVARLRIYGKITPEYPFILPGEPVNLASLMNGACAVDCSDAFFSPMQNLLQPGRGSDMHDGWETKRRRSGGYDWMVVKLSCAGYICRVEVDTLHFKGNFPDSCTIDACYVADDTPDEKTVWKTLIPVQKLSAHRNHVFLIDNQQTLYTHVRLNIFPDGGVSRLRVIGFMENQQ